MSPRSVWVPVATLQNWPAFIRPGKDGISCRYASLPSSLLLNVGSPAGSIITAVIALYVWQALCTSPAAVDVFASIDVFLLIEQRTYHVPTDVALFAVWLATLDLLAVPGFDAHPEPRE